ncbi:hypothetical protein EVG20_g8398 [Dentipellis fragilis]|uniref:Uncharacterized protein n=1 Tax=Dentipellis fragilis TaxID=205917 RepID=A0A4Y9Y6W7_9AGAM|nr:hypothetical protein EVG20_g8398 [Dentipellis fragilis]
MSSPSLPKTQKAAVLQKDLISCAVETIPVNPPGPGEVLIKNTVAAQNPTDWKSIHFKRIKPGQSTGWQAGAAQAEATCRPSANTRSSLRTR